MDLDDLSLSQIIYEYQSVFQSKKRKNILEQELDHQNSILGSLQDSVTKEYDDVKFLETASLRRLFTNILANEKAQLDKERQEYLEAVMKFRDARKATEIIHYEIDVLNKNISREASIERKISEKLGKEDIHKESPEFKDLKIVHDKLDSAIKLKVESWEALQIANDVHDHFIMVVRLLNRAKDYDKWGRFYQEVQHHKSEKKSYIDQAEQIINQIDVLLKILHRELLDVINNLEIKENLYPNEIDMTLKFYNNLITDWIKNENLTQTINATHSFSLLIKKIIRKLTKEYKLAEDNIQKYESEHKELIKTFNT